MRFEHKMKKLFSEEGDALLQKKKEKILAGELLRQAEAQLPPASLPQKSPFLFKKVLATAASFVLVLAIVLSLPLFTPAAQPPVTRPGTEQVATDEGVVVPSTTKTEEKPAFAFKTWLGASDIPFAIVEIQEITNEELSYRKGNVKVLCKVLYSHYTEYFKINEEAFANIQEFYFLQETVKQLSVGDQIWFRLQTIPEPEGPYFTPTQNQEIQNHEIQAQLLFFEEGKLVLNSEDSANGFYYLFDLNKEIDHVKWLEEKGFLYKGSPEHLFPKEHIQSGMTVDEVAKWFSAWDHAQKLALEALEKDGYFKSVTP